MKINSKKKFNLNNINNINISKAPTKENELKHKNNKPTPKCRFSYNQ
jgi:hypothetical protein